MRTVIAVALLVACVFAAVDRKAQFEAWLQQNNKAYSGLEFGRRLAIFSDNAALVEKHNNEGHSWELGLNEFADLTHEEFLATYLQPAFAVAEPQPEASVGAYANVNWVSKGAVVAIKNQGQCGSCWSFSATGAIEGAWQISGKTLTSFSEQQGLDCAPSKNGCNGCNGGSMDGAFKYYISFGGIETESDYPYTGTKGTCKASTSKIAGKISKYTDVKSGSEDSLYTALSKQPVSIAMDASKADFQLYKSGCYCPSGCSTTTLDHGVLLVGSETADSNNGNKNSWYIKNSWGTTWGIKGYFYLCQGQNECGVSTMASYPTV
jgi:C1A family cysteine protease